MAAVNYRIDASKGFSGVLGPQLLNVIENLNQSFAQLLLHRARLIQLQDDATNTDTEYVTASKVYGFVDSGDVLSSAVAHAAFVEIDSMVSTCTAALQQLGARFKQ